MPQKGDKRALLELAQRDVVEMSKTLEIKAATAREKEEAVCAAIAGLLGQPEPQEAYRVESYDISNTNGVDTVGAMVVFRNQKPVKKDYRRFKIRTRVRTTTAVCRKCSIADFAERKKVIRVSVPCRI